MFTKDDFWIDEKSPESPYVLRNDGDPGHPVIARLLDERDAYEALERLQTFYTNKNA